MNLEGVSFQWRTDEYQEKEFPEGRHYGFIAQDVEEVLPEVVRTDDNGEKAINYSAIIPTSRSPILLLTIASLTHA